MNRNINFFFFNNLVLNETKDSLFCELICVTSSGLDSHISKMHSTYLKTTLIPSKRIKYDFSFIEENAHVYTDTLSFTCTHTHTHKYLLQLKTRLT